ncbi:MAG: hypothetical protein AAB578_06345 [Elusimicrobiota bacterium]
MDDWQHKFLSGLARKKGLSVSALVRRWIEELAGGMKDRPDSLLDMAGIAEDAATDVSENTDAYLYGDKRRDRE